MQKEMKCRGCAGIICEKPMLSYKNMPGSAQGFLKLEQISQEKGIDIDIYQCPYCGLVQILGEPVPYYRDVIRATGVSAEMAAFRRAQYQEFVSDYALEGKKIIEIGVGCGEYMQFMVPAGADVYGLEHKLESVEKAVGRGLKVLQGYVEDMDYKIPEAPFAGFYSMSYLEHVPKPGIFLRGIANNLTEDAVGLVEVPNFDMMLEKQLFSEFIIDHLSYFTKDTLSRLLEANGFEVLSCESIWYDYILSAVVRKRKRLHLQGFKERQRVKQQSVDHFFSEQAAAGRKVAVWGAGHQALADLSLLNMKDKVEFIVDSADFKQNLFTPATHLPIFEPKRINTGIRAVLIMAAGYSDEIANILKREYPEVEVSAILRENGVEYV